MTKKTSGFVGMASLILLVFLVGFMYGGEGSSLTIQTASGPVMVEVEIADTAEKRIQGLMDRDTLPPGKGMLFVYDEATQVSMWMKNMRISLDILFIDEELRVAHIERDVPPCDNMAGEECEQYTSPQEIQFVLELPGGISDAQAIAVGDKISLPVSFLK